MEDSFEILKSLILIALELAELQLPIFLEEWTENDLENLEDLRMNLTVCLQKIKDDNLEAIAWTELREYINSLEQLNQYPFGSK